MRPDPYQLIEKYCGDNHPLRDIIIGHSEAVRDKALRIADRLDLNIDREFVADAAMLHDIGVVKVDAPSIYCHGSLPYICHGIAGKQILQAEGWPLHALVCERHTGSGLTAEEIVCEKLPLPAVDMLPISTEEKLICYADKFFSKSRDLRAEKPVEKIMAQMDAHGPAVGRRFRELHRLFGF